MIFDWLRKQKPGLDASEEAPSSYAQWSAVLDDLSRDDDDERCLRRLESGQLSWIGGVAPLFVKRVADEVQRRLNLCADKLSRDLGGGLGEQVVVRALLQCRKQLCFIDRICHLSCMPEATQVQLSDEVRRFAERSQQSLLDTALSDRSGQLSRWIRGNALTAYAVQQPATPAPLATTPTQSPGSISGRRRVMK